MKKDVVAFVVGLMFLSAVYGYLASSRHLFPYGVVQAAKQGYHRISELLGWSRPWYYVESKRVERAVSHKQDSIEPGLTLVSGIGAKSQIEARVIDQAGETIHRWSLNWFDLWPDATHVDELFKPILPPGTHVHGMVILDNGDLVFNLERTGLFRVDLCGKTVWRVPRMTHHSVFRDEEGDFWVASTDVVHEPRADLPGFVPPFIEDKILKISADGKVLDEWSAIDLLKANGLESLLYVATNDTGSVVVKRDSLHLNDVEIFPKSLPRGIFAPGDMMISLRNINTIIVFNKDMKTVKHVFRGPFIRQHDPDFIDGNSITIFDNYPPSKQSTLARSRILRMDARQQKVEVLYEASEKQPFFTEIMGKQQLLGNGNLLLTEALSGRAMEVSPKAGVVWEYINIVDDHVAGLLDEAQRLPVRFDKAFFLEGRRRCGA